jgi:nucleoside phosphorylase
MSTHTLRREDYTIGWLCALHTELRAATLMLDEEHLPLDLYDVDDINQYVLGRIGKHNIVITCLPAGQMGTSPAIATAVQMLSTFKSIRYGLMVGIGGGVPSSEADIRLGDVVVSHPINGYGGVVQYDFGKSKPGGFEPGGFLNAPPTVLLNAVNRLRSNPHKLNGNLSSHMRTFAHHSIFRRDRAGPDVLFKSTYNHAGGPTCESCNKREVIERQSRNGLEIHYGLIASGNQVIRDGKTRDEISAKFGGVHCFEMEAAGLMNRFPSLAIRGICDYSDSHKNKLWQPYAAASAAAYAKELVLLLPIAKVLSSSSSSSLSLPSKYQIPFSLRGVPILSNKFVDRPDDMKALYDALLPEERNQCRRQVFVLRGLGGIGKTQLAAEFARRTHQRFSAIFWLDGSSERNLKQSIAVSASRIPEGQIPEASRKFSESSVGNLESTISDVMSWLSQPNNSKWLIIFDNIDLDYQDLIPDPESYDIRLYLPNLDHGSILITTRLATLEQLGSARKLDKVDDTKAREIFEKWYGQKFSKSCRALF